MKLLYTFCALHVVLIDTRANELMPSAQHWTETETHLDLTTPQVGECNVFVCLLAC